ncbi:hypothetical protein EDD85DRAFT_984145 [Armillaria nabsnona]|nr:hypothetical protein EDD85DRAFT_984145 [Armillaria nabsnona]
MTMMTEPFGALRDNSRAHRMRQELLFYDDSPAHRCLPNRAPTLVSPVPCNHPSHPIFGYPPFFGWGNTNLLYARSSDPPFVVQEPPSPSLSHILSYGSTTTPTTPPPPFSISRNSVVRSFSSLDLFIAIKTAPTPPRPFFSSQPCRDQYNDLDTVRLDVQHVYPLVEHARHALRRPLCSQCSLQRRVIFFHSGNIILIITY